MRTQIQEIGYKFSCIADQLRGQAALNREDSDKDLSCVLDELADQMTELASPLMSASDDLKLAA